MPDIIGQILQRLEALETAVHGRASEHFDRKLFKPQVALREGVVARTIERNVAAGRFPPPDGVTNGHAWWWLATLERHDRAVAAKPATTHTPPNAGPPRGRSGRDAEMKGLRLRGAKSRCEGIQGEGAPIERARTAGDARVARGADGLFPKDGRR